MPIVVGETTFQVPDGFQAIIRGVTIIPSIVISNTDATGTTPVEMFMSFLTNGAGVRQNTRRSIRLIGGANPFILFFTVRANAIITMALEMDQSVFSTIGTGFNCSVSLHGNLLVDDGRPDNRIVSTRVQEKN